MTWYREGQHGGCGTIYVGVNLSSQIFRDRWAIRRPEAQHPEATAGGGKRFCDGTRPRRSDLPLRSFYRVWCVLRGGMVSREERARAVGSRWPIPGTRIYSRPGIHTPNERRARVLASTGVRSLWSGRQPDAVYRGDRGGIKATVYQEADVAGRFNAAQAAVGT